MLLPDKGMMGLDDDRCPETEAEFVMHAARQVGLDSLQDPEDSRREKMPELQDNQYTVLCTPY